MPQKSRMTALDVRAVVSQLRPLLVGLRLANIYDLSFSRRIYLLKFAKGDSKYHILVESGIRVHPTEWNRAKGSVPSSFTMKMRKHLRARRLEQLLQLGSDRVIDFVFGVGETATHLIVELYVSGNVVLTDAKYSILSVLRPHSNVDAGRVAVDHNYPIPTPDLSFCLIPSLLTATKEHLITKTMTVQSIQAVEDAIVLFGQEKLKALESQKKERIVPKPHGKKKDKKGVEMTSASATVLSYRDVLAPCLPFAHLLLISHALTIAFEKEGLDTTGKIENRPLTIVGEESKIHLRILRNAAIECLKVVIAISSPHDYLGTLTNDKDIFADHKPSIAGYATIESVVELPKTRHNDEPKLPLAEEKGHVDELPCLPRTHFEILGDFTPYLLRNHLNLSPDIIKKFDTFIQCVDTFFSSLELKKQNQQDQQEKSQGGLKSHKILQDQSRRVHTLEDEQAKCSRYVELIEANLQLVSQCITMLQSALSTGVAWIDLWNHIKLERRGGHPLASIIHSLDLENERVFLLLESSTVSQDQMEDIEVEAVPVDLNTTAYGNIERLHTGRKQMGQKVMRTQMATKTALEKAIKRNEQTKQHQISKVGGGVITKLRKHFWFEKFNWFISSENFLILAGRDAQQNDILYKRYFEKNDIYVHADIHGAASCIIKNPTNEPVPPTTLLEAGRMSVCRSSAWDNKIVTSAWWVYRSQVSKTAPTGEYLTSGAFIIRGRKNFLPPWKLEMGFGVLFQLGEDSIEAHRGERKKKAIIDDPMTEEKDYKDINARQDPYGVGFPSENSRRKVEEELAALILKDEEEEAQKQLRRLQKQQQKSAKIEPKEKSNILLQPKKDPNNRNIPSKGVVDDVLALNKPLPRGKRSKMKKLKNKYKEQEPEERELRMKLLGAKEMKGVAPSFHSPPTTERQNFSPSEGEEEKEQAARVLSADNQHDAIINDSVDELEVKQMRKLDFKEIDQTESQFAKIENKEDLNEGRGYDVDEAGAEAVLPFDEGLTMKLAELDILTAQPKTDDSLIAAVPVCAPWSSLQGYKYKIKLLPGTMKKGKAGQQAIKLLMLQAAGTEMERNLIKMIDMNDMGHALVSNLKLSVPGFAEMQKAEKVSKRQKKKELNAVADSE